MISKKLTDVAVNIASNYIAVLFLGVLNLALAPIYVHWLGPEEWGLVATCMTLQSFLGILDAGLGQLMPRDMARASGNLAAEASIYRLYLRAYFVISCIAFMVGQSSAHWLALNWFNSGAGDDGNVVSALRIVVFQFVFQFSNNANNGFWIGRQQQRLANSRQCIFVFLKHIIAVVFLMAWKQDYESYLIPFAAVSILEFTANSFTIQRVLEPARRLGRVPTSFAALAREAGGMASGIFIGAILTQTDRIVLSKTTDMSSFGRYVLVANLGTALFQLQHPILRAYMPRIVQEDDRGEAAFLSGLLRYIILFCVVPCVVVSIFAGEILDSWVGEMTLIADGTDPLRLIALAVALNSLYGVVYHIMIARGEWRWVTATNIAALVITVPLTTCLSEAIGITAGGVSWLSISSVQVSMALLWLAFARSKKRQKMPIPKNINTLSNKVKKKINSALVSLKLPMQFMMLRSATPRRFSLRVRERWLCVDDYESETSFDRHYVFHTAWACRVLAETCPEEHVDISSSLYFCSQISAFLKVRFFDYRPAALDLSGLTCERADLTRLHLPDDTVLSLSCMHVVEHIGLGRYGDQLDYDGDLKAVAELRRVLAVGGQLLFVVPIGGESRIQFNAHRIYTYRQVLHMFEKMELVEFALIPDDGDIRGLVRGATEEQADQQRYGCGCFWFRKIAR